MVNICPYVIQAFWK